MGKNINIDSRNVARWMQTQIATSNKLKSVLKETEEFAKEVAVATNADSIDEIAKQLTELGADYCKIHRNYVEINNQMLKTNKKAEAAASLR